MLKTAIGPEFRAFAEETVDVSEDRALDFLVDDAAEIVGQASPEFLQKLDKRLAQKAKEEAAKAEAAAKKAQA